MFFDFKGSFLSFVFEFGIFWSKAKLIFGQFRAILLLGPSKSGRSLWVKKWISFFSTGVTEQEHPSRFAFAVGGKDGVPHPVDTKTYDKTIDMLKDSVEKSKLGDKEKSVAIKRLHRATKSIESK